MRLYWPILFLLLLPGCTAGAIPIPTAAASDPIPIFAYYYIWFDENSWERAKTDYPLLGRYSSDDVEVMRTHIFWAKGAGIRGFIVSWKSTPKLDARLAQLIQVAEADGFKLAIIYQGLDFLRNPLPITEIEADLDAFVARYAGSPVFDAFEKPVVILSGSWKFTPEEVARLTVARRDDLLILASEKDAAGYQRLANTVDGNAYYWSSVDPRETPGYLNKLQGIGEAVHANGGLWIAPAAPGFDARVLGGTRVIERRNGQTLREELSAALRSAPDLIGLISWNEFSENSHVEPSEDFGERYLEVLSDIRGADVPDGGNPDSSEPGGTSGKFDFYQIAAIGALLILVLSGLGVLIWRNRFQ